MPPPKGASNSADAPAKLSSTLLNLPFMQRGKQPPQQQQQQRDGAAPGAAPQAAGAGAAAGEARRAGGETAKLSDRLQGMKFMQRGAQKRKVDDAFGDDEAKQKEDAEVSREGPLFWRLGWRRVDAAVC